MAIKIICDSTSSITREYAIENDIDMLPLSVSVSSGENFVEGFATENDAIYAACDLKNSYPKTSQPTSVQFATAFKKVIDAGDEAIFIGISSALSGTVGGAESVRREIDKDNKISVLDSWNAGPVIFLYIQEMVEMIKAGKSRQEIVACIEKKRETGYSQFVPEALEHLKRNGRIGKVSALIGGILHLKPILTFKDNVLRSTKKVIGISKAITEIVSSIPATVKKILVLQVNNAVSFPKLFAAIKEKFSNIFVAKSDVSIVVGSHVGPAFGVAVLD